MPMKSTLRKSRAANLSKGRRHWPAAAEVDVNDDRAQERRRGNHAHIQAIVGSCEGKLASVDCALLATARASYQQ